MCRCGKEGIEWEEGVVLCEECQELEEEAEFLQSELEAFADTIAFHDMLSR